MKDKYSPEQMEFMIKRSGSDAEAAKCLGISRRTVTYHRTKLGILSKRFAILPKRNAKIVKLRKEGYKIREIAEIMKLSMGHINYIIKAGKEL